MQVLLVAGGWDGGNKLSSTEILVTLAGEWRTVGPLPTAVSYLCGATLDNTVYMLGEWCTDIYSVMVCWHLMFQEDMMMTVYMTPSSATTRTRSSGAQLAA